MMRFYSFTALLVSLLVCYFAEARLLDPKTVQEKLLQQEEQPVVDLNNNVRSKSNSCRWNQINKDDERFIRLQKVEQCFIDIYHDGNPNKAPIPRPRKRDGTFKDYHYNIYECQNDNDDWTTLIPPSPEKMIDYFSTQSSIYFIGDSILLQVFEYLMCLMDPDSKHFTHDWTTPGGHNFTYHTSTDYSLWGLKKRPGDLEFFFRPFGRLWKGEKSVPDNLFHGAFPEALQKENSLIVLDAGAHYHANTAQVLQEHSQYIVEQAKQHAQASIYFLETPDLQFPTSNGDYTGLVEDEFYDCQALTQEQMDGFAKPVKKSATCNNCFFPDHLRTNPVLKSLYPDSIEKRYTSKDCTPHCLPANWRNDITNSVFLDKEQPAKVISIWDILTQHEGELHNWGTKDCLHKNTDALLAISQQLLKTLVASRSKTSEVTAELQ
mmetsp:Transcript_32675/g.49242  ORF Transcript_32675/g.49242 Transcript_32675/m.49242 type:complete len:435 (-) Transcript_32675:330-1634(-)